MKGILFKPDMIMAITEGRKTVTRRVIKFKQIPNIINSDWHAPWFDNNTNEWVFTARFGLATRGQRIKPRYQVGEVVYIKETLFRHPYLNEAGYMLDSSPVFVNQTIGDMLKWRWKKDTLSSMFMPLEAARYFIKIANVRAERVQEITEEDIGNEGLEVKGWTEDGSWRTPQDCFQYLWDSINKDFPFESNPYIFRYEFALAPSGAMK